MKRAQMDEAHFAACKRRADAANAAGREYAAQHGGSWGPDIKPGGCMRDGGPCAECEAEVRAQAGA